MVTAAQKKAAAEAQAQADEAAALAGADHGDPGATPPAPSDPPETAPVEAVSARVLVDNVILNEALAGVPGQSGDVTFAKGTPAADMPEWAVAALGAHVWSDTPATDDRIVTIMSRLEAYGAPADMAASMAEFLAAQSHEDPATDDDGNELEISKYEAAVRLVLGETRDPAKLTDAIGEWRRAREKHAGESYTDYVARAHRDFADPVPWPLWLAETDATKATVEVVPGTAPTSDEDLEAAAHDAAGYVPPQ